LHGLARVVSLPPGLPAKDEQTLADAIWDSTNLAHDLVIRVADVVTGKSWLTLIHEHSEGSLLEFLQRCAEEVSCPFPAKVAARIALDVVEGLEQSRDYCASAGIPWRPGSVSPGSLLLGPDGRIRALDGQITAAALRVPALRAQPGASAFAAPEMLDDARDPNERSDVFSIGVLLWELLTGKTLFGEKSNSLDLGHSFKIPKISHSLPEGTKVPQGLVHAVHTALEAEPLKRQASLRELAVAIVMGVEEVATYAQVIDFTDAILEPRSDEDSRPAAAAPEPVVSQDVPLAPVNLPVEQTPVPVMPPVETAAPVAEVPLLDRPLVREVPLVQQPQVAPTPGDARAESVTESLPARRDKLDTLPGQGSRTPVEVELRASTEPTPTPPGLSPQPELQQPQALPPDPAPPAPVDLAQIITQAAPSIPPAQPFRLVSEEPFVPVSVQPVQTVGDAPNRPATIDADPLRSSSSRPAPATTWDDTGGADAVPGLPKKRTLQLSMGTLILGFSTTVLAVIVIMLVMQRGSGSKESPSTSSAAALQPVAPNAPGVQPVEVANPERATAESATQTDAGIAASAGAKADHHKRAAKDQGKAPGKSGSTEDEPASGDSKAAGQGPNKHYIPNEL
jgi:serine/threonine protein kinase